MDAFANLDPLGGKSSSSKTPAYPYPIQQQQPPPQQQAYGQPPQQAYGMPPPQQMNMGGGLGMGGGMNYGMPPAGAPPQMNGMFGQVNQQQQVAPPIMYDSIKNLLQKKPDPVEASGGADPFSCFTGGAPKPSSRTNSGNLNLDTKSQPPSGGAYDPFSGGATPASTPTSVGSQPSGITSAAANLSIFGDAAPSTGNITTASNTPKNSALADRLRGGKRQTQEAQRATLSINSTAVPVGGTSVSIKKQLGGAAGPTTAPAVASQPTSSPDNLLGF